jgi:hypothetical protein
MPLSRIVRTVAYPLAEAFLDSADHFARCAGFIIDPHRRSRPFPEEIDGALAKGLVERVLFETFCQATSSWMAREIYFRVVRSPVGLVSATIEAPKSLKMHGCLKCQ